MSVLAAALGALPLPAALPQAVSDLNWSGDVRYRYAAISDDAFDAEARASTLRLTLGARTEPIAGFSIFAQGRTVQPLGADDYNSTVNGLDDFPVEPDPRASELSQAFLEYEAPRLSAWAGRRQVSWGHERFVSAYDWRQHGRSFDGLGLEAQPVAALTLRYQYAFNVNRAVSDRNEDGNYNGDFHFVDATVRAGERWGFNAYAFGHDFSEAFAQALSARTFGASAAGSVPLEGGVDARVHLELAHQSEAGSNPETFSHLYLRAEAGLHRGWAGVRAGFEHLGGDGESAFQTPFGDLHRYNGFSDRFLDTPPDGLEDLYVEARVEAGDWARPVFDGAALSVAYHAYSAAEGAQDYGTEWELEAKLPITARVEASVKASIYDASGFSTSATGFSTSRNAVWASLRARF